MEPKEWKLLLAFFKRLRQKAYEVKFERGRTVTMAMRKVERPLLNRIDQLIQLTESELRINEKNVKFSKDSWTFIVSILRKERDFFDEFKKDKELKQVLQKFLKRGDSENELQ